MRARLTTFVGRGAEFAEVRRLLDAGERLITVVGPPGIGKTRLAAEVLRAHGEGRFCDLSNATTALDACTAVAAALAATIDPTADRAGAVQAIGDALARDEIGLVVLDNAEPIVGPVSEMAPAWLEAAPALRLLVTSRERLGVDGERVLPLPPLGLPRSTAPAEEAESVRLLLDRVERLGRGWRPGPTDGPLLAELVEALEGIPLAIELAAPRLATLGPVDLLRRLRESFAVLRAAAPRRAHRGRTLRDAIDASFRLLSADEQRALAQCSLFRGGFTAEAAEAVLALPEGAPPVLDVLERLADKSLLFVRPASGPESPRLDCYLSIREHAAEALEEQGGGAEARARHAAFFVAEATRRAASLDGPDAAPARRWFERERDNLRQAVRSALECGAADRAAAGVVALDRYVTNVGPLREHLELLDDAVTALGRGEDAGALARVLDARGYTRLRLGDVDGGLADLERALGLLGREGDDALRATILRSTGVGRVKQNRHEDARRAFAEAVEAARRAGDRRTEGMATGGLGVVHLLVGDLGEARRVLERAIAIHREVGNAKFEGVVHGNLADVHLELGDLDAALHHYEQALALHRATGNRFSEAWVKGSIAVVSHERGRLDEALALYDEAVTMAAQAGELQYEAMFAGYAGIAELERGELARAETWLRRAVEQCERLGDARHAALFGGWLGAALARCGRLADAAAAFEAARERRGARDLPPLAALEAAVDLARAERAAADGDGAESLRLRARARDRVAALAAPGDGAAPIARSFDARLAFRVLDRALPAPEATEAPALVVESAGRWFQPPGGERVDCTRRRTASRVLALLAHERLRAPGRPVTAEELLAAGWPGERMRPQSARNRLHVTVSTLRRLGLDAVRSVPGGYLLDPDLPLRLEGAEPADNADD